MERPACLRVRAADATAVQRVSGVDPVQGAVFLTCRFWSDASRTSRQGGALDDRMSSARGVLESVRFRVLAIQVGNRQFLLWASI